MFKFLLSGKREAEKIIKHYNRYHYSTYYCPNVYEILTYEKRNRYDFYSSEQTNVHLMDDYHEVFFGHIKPSDEIDFTSFYINITICDTPEKKRMAMAVLFGTYLYRKLLKQPVEVYLEDRYLNDILSNDKFVVDFATTILTGGHENLMLAMKICNNVKDIVKLFHIPKKLAYHIAYTNGYL